MRSVALVVFAAACFTSKTPPPILANKVVAPTGSVLTITQTSFGPIDARSTATLVGLRALFVGFDVKPFHDGTLEYDVYRGGEKLLFVVPNDDDATVFNVHAVSPKIAVEGRSWRVGRRFEGRGDLTTCECWGPNPTCFRPGDHVAVNFNRDCDGLTNDDDRSLKLIEGLEIQRIIWSPKPFGVSTTDDDASSP